MSAGTSGDFYHEFSPQLRQADFIAGLEEYKREIEFAVGLSYGDISNPQTVDKTATEVKSSKQRKFDIRWRFIMGLLKAVMSCL